MYFCEEINIVKMKESIKLALLLCLLISSASFTAAADEASDSVIIHDPAEYISGTLPVMYITTDSLKPVVTKDYYITGKYYLDANGIEGYESIGSPENPLPLSIKGRGNASWRLEKKPYKIKLDKKAALMGMPKSKQFALMAHYEDWRGYLIDESGFELSRRIGMSFTPKQEPIELVLNGDYVGIYFLTQNIKVDKERVNIVEQDDNDTIPENVTGGWLLEKDNYQDSPQIVLPNDFKLWFTVHSPEVLSDVQYNYISDFLSKADSLICSPDKSQALWKKYIDIDTLARYYIVSEIVENTEAFSGSCYMHKDRGENTKIVFGPMWDFGSSFAHPSGNFSCWIFEDEPAYVHNVWIKDLVQFPEFQYKIRKIWTKEYDKLVDGLETYLHDWAYRLRPAGYSDHLRWESSGGHDIPYQSQKHITRIKNRIAELDGLWNLKNLYDVNHDGTVDVVDINDLLTKILRYTCDQNYDVNMDGEVDVADVNDVVNFMLEHTEIVPN